MASFRDRLRNYYQDPFGTVDNLNLRIRRLDFNVFSRSRSVARNMFLFSMAMMLLWAIFGFDSSPMQLTRILETALPAWLEGRPIPDVMATFTFYYGKGTHYSAFVIYGLMFWALSVHFDQGLDYTVHNFLARIGMRGAAITCETGLGITKSRNIVYSSCLTLLAGGTFEMFWIYSFAFWQRQPWIGVWQAPQLMILAQNMVFILIGGFGLIYMWADSYALKGKEVLGRRFCFKVNWKLWGLLAITLVLVLLWWFYPFQVQPLSVLLTDGTAWTNSARFPQTLYTIKLDPTGQLNAGTWFWIPDDAIHALNTIAKVFWSLTLLYFGLVQKVEENGKNKRRC